MEAVVREAGRRLRRLVFNPLIVKDGLYRMRSWRAPLAIAVYLSVLGVFAGLVLLVQLASSRPGWGGYGHIGGITFTALAMVQLGLVCLFAPGIAASAISGERERQTLDVLTVTNVTPFGIVWGKLVASVAFVLLLVVSALPLFATVFLFGGIDFLQFVLTITLTVSTAVATAAVSLFLSALFRRAVVATVLAYGLAFAGSAGTAIVGLLLTAYTWSRDYATKAPIGPFPTPDPNPLLYMNPFNAMLTVLQNVPERSLPVGRMVQLFFLVPGVPSDVGPAVASWKMTVLVQIVLVVLSVGGAVLLLRGRRPLGPFFVHRANLTAADAPIYVKGGSVED